MIQMGLRAQDPQLRAKSLSDAQMQLGWALRAAVQECQEAGLSWQAIGTALGVPKETLFRQFSAGGPVITAKPVQSMSSPGATTMHRSGVEAVYAFRSQNGNWFGPHTALPDGEFTDGTLHFEPAQPTSPFAGQVLTMRFGPQEHDVSVHACQVTLPDGAQRRVRVTHAVLDLMFGDGQTPLRQAMTALTHAAMGNPRVPAQLHARRRHHRPALRKGQQPAGSHLQRPAHSDTNRLTSPGPKMISVTCKKDGHPWLTFGLVICKFCLTGERE